MKNLITIASGLLLAWVSVGLAGYDMTISASDEDPYVNTGSPPGGGIGYLYLWAAAHTPDVTGPGISAFCGSLSGSGISVMGVVPADSVINIGSGNDLFLAIANCSGDSLPRNLARIVVYDSSGTLALVPRPGDSCFAATDCAQVKHDVYAVGFASDGGLPPVSRDVGWVYGFGYPDGDGLNAAVLAFEQEDSTQLYVGGEFDTAGSVSASRVARWDGSSWHALGAGVSHGNPSAVVHALLKTSDEDLAVGGAFDSAGTSAVYNVARWNGTGWSAYGPGFNNRVYSLAEYGEDHDLVAGGLFIRRQSGQNWEMNRVALWDGADWLPLTDSTTGQNGVCIDTPSDGGEVRTIVEYDQKLIVAGTFNKAGGRDATNIAAWQATSGGTWGSLGDGLNGTVHALVIHDDCLVAGGSFSGSGATELHGIAKWNGVSWSPVGGGMEEGSDVYALHSLGLDGLVVGGAFTAAILAGTGDEYAVKNVALWRGMVWQTFGGGLDKEGGASVEALAFWNGGWFFGGDFELGLVRRSTMHVPSHMIAQWSDLEPVGVGWNPPPASSSQVVLYPPRPNPTASGARVVYSLPTRTHVVVDIFDVQGRRVIGLLEKTQDAGLRSVVWDGRDSCGRRAASGVYFVRLWAGGRSYAQKALLLR